MSVSWTGHCTIVAPNVTIGGNWAKCTQNLSVLFLTPTCDSATISVNISSKNENDTFRKVFLSSEWTTTTKIYLEMGCLPHALPHWLSCLFPALAWGWGEFLKLRDLQWLPNATEIWNNKVAQQSCCWRELRSGYWSRSYGHRAFFCSPPGFQLTDFMRISDVGTEE